MGQRAGKKKRGALVTIVDLALAAAAGYLVWAMLGTALERANIDSDLRIVTKEARDLYDAFQAFNERNEGYPADYAGRVFDPTTLDPLRKRGYYRGHIEARLNGERIDAYGSPDDRGLNQEFWLEMSLARDPRIRVLIARSDDAPLGAGEWREGVYVFRGGKLRAL